MCSSGNGGSDELTVRGAGLVSSFGLGAGAGTTVTGAGACASAAFSWRARRLAEEAWVLVLFDALSDFWELSMNGVSSKRGGEKAELGLAGLPRWTRLGS